MALLRQHSIFQGKGKAPMEKQDGGDRSTMHYYSLVPYHLSYDSQKDFSFHQKHRLE